MEININNLSAGGHKSKGVTNRQKILSVLKENSYMKSLNDFKLLSSTEIMDLSNVSPINQVNQILYRLHQEGLVFWFKEHGRNYWALVANVDMDNPEVVQLLKDIGISHPAIPQTSLLKKEKKESANNN